MVEGPEEDEDPMQTLPNITGYEWASRDVREFNTLFINKTKLGDWVENNYIVKILEYSRLIKLSVYLSWEGQPSQ